MKKKIIITGTAGFIGFHLTKKLISDGFEVIGIDNLSNYYDVSLKRERLKELEIFCKENSNDFELNIISLEDNKKLNEIFKKHNPKIVINLAGQAGVRFSISNPQEYVSSNIYGFLNILENCRKYKIEHLLYASSSSVYGGNIKTPFCENDAVDHPVSFYAATKRTNELMAHNYSHIYQLPTTGMRFFTVYGPWGRPDMAPMIFAKAIFSKNPIKVFNYGDMSRDFTYVEDAVEFVYRLLNIPPKSNKEFDNFSINPEQSWAPFRILNIGNGNPTNLMDFINILEKEIGIKTSKVFEKMNQGDVKNTYANIDSIISLTGYEPKVNINNGIKNFVRWYKNYFKIN